MKRETLPRKDDAALPYVWFWNRMGRKGERCRVIARGRMNSALLEFEDGFRAVTSRSGLRRAPSPEPKETK